MSETICRECSETKHGACDGTALVEVGDELETVPCACAGRGHAPGDPVEDEARAEAEKQWAPDEDVPSTYGIRALCRDTFIKGYLASSRREPSARELRECTICGEQVTISNATPEWETRHKHPKPEKLKRFDPEFRATLIDFAAARIQDVWNDVGETDAQTLAENVVKAQEWAWMSAQVPVTRPEPSDTDEREWEYGITWSPPVTGDEPASYDGCETLEGARAAGRQLAGPAQTATIWKRPMRPAVMALPAGEWEVVSDAE